MSVAENVGFKPAKTEVRLMSKPLFLSSRIAAIALALLASCTPSDAPKTTESETPARPAGSYHVYVTNERSDDVTIIDSVTNEVVATVALGKRPRGIHASPDGQTIYVALSGTPIGGPNVDESKLPPPDKKADGIGVFDVKTRKLLRVIEGGSDPEEFDLSKDGSKLFTSNEDTGEASVVDVAMGKVLETLKVGAEPEGVNASPDGRFVYVTSEEDGEVFVIDTEAHKVVKSLKVGNRPRSVGFLPDGKKAYVTNENDGTLAIIDTAKLAKTGEIALGKAGVIKPMKVILSTDGKTAYVSTGRGKQLFMIDTATDKVKGSPIEVGERPWGIALSPDGKFLYSANGPSNDVSVVDLSTNTVIKKIMAGTSPWGVLVVQH